MDVIFRGTFDSAGQPILYCPEPSCGLGIIGYEEVVDHVERLHPNNDENTTPRFSHDSLIRYGAAVAAGELTGRAAFFTQQAFGILAKATDRRDRRTSGVELAMDSLRECENKLYQASQYLHNEAERIRIREDLTP